MKNNTCCFTGHRDISFADSDTVIKNLYSEVEKAILEGYRHFITGGARGFDTLAAETVLELKNTYPDIRLHVIIPCKNQTRGWNEEDIKRYEYVLKNSDETKCLSENYYNGCMQVRNRYMVDNSSRIITYVTRNSGGSAYTIDYAKKQGLTQRTVI